MLYRRFEPKEHKRCVLSRKNCKNLPIAWTPPANQALNKNEDASSSIPIRIGSDLGLRTQPDRGQSSSAARSFSTTNNSRYSAAGHRTKYRDHIGQPDTNHSFKPPEAVVYAIRPGELVRSSLP